MVTIRIPALPAGLLSNLLGLAGLLAAVVAVGGITGNWWWSVLVGGLAAVGLSVIAAHNAAPARDEQVSADQTAEIPRITARSRLA